jgi:hypothetical protein
MKKLILILSFISTMLVGGCLNEINELREIKGFVASSDLALPLINDAVGIKELYETFSQTGIIREPDGKPITIVYSGRDSISQRQFISIPSTTIQLNLNIDPLMAQAFNATGSFSQTISDVQEILFTNEEELEEILVKSGGINLFLSTTIKHRVSVTYTYPSIKRNGVAYTDSVILTFGGTIPTVSQRFINLAGYSIDLTNGGTDKNKLPYTLTIRITEDPLQPEMVGNENLTLSKSVDVLQYRFLKGYLGKFSLLNMSEEVEIDLFYGAESGSIELKDPRMYIEIFNGFGLPITARIYDIFARLKDNTRLDVQFQQYKDTITLPFAQSPGEYAKGVYEINRFNSNIDQVMNSRPIKLIFKIEFIANFYGNTVNNFLYDTSSLKSKADIELPLDLRINNYVVTNENFITLPGANSNDAINIEQVLLASIATSTFPIGTDIQVYFIKFDSITNTQTIIDSLFQSKLRLAAANVNENGDVISGASAESIGSLTPTQYRRLIDQGCNYYRIRFEANSSSSSNGTQPFVKIFSNQKVELKVGFKGRGIIKQSFN